MLRSDFSVLNARLNIISIMSYNFSKLLKLINLKMIRKIEKTDRDNLKKYFLELVTVDQERVERPQDAAKISNSDEEKWIESRLIGEEKKEIFTLCGFNDNGAIIAEGEIQRLPRWIERHVAEIRFAVLPGHELIAQQMINELIKKSQENGIEILIYFHLSSQKTGIEIIKKFGFEQFGIIKKYYKKNDRYIDRLYFVKYQ